MSAPIDDGAPADAGPAAGADLADDEVGGDPAGGGGPGPEAAPEGDAGFTVHLDNFDGPFDLLLRLIEKRELDVTEVAIHSVTDDFIAHTRELGVSAELEEVTEFLVVAATLLDLKAARLVPSGEVDDIEDLELLHARDLLFARLLQFRAYQQVSELFAELDARAQRSFPRTAGPDPEYLDLMPEVELGVGPEQFALLAAVVFRPRPPEEVGTAHIHAPAVSVPEQAGRVLDLLRLRGSGQWLGFADLVAGCEETIVVVARFLALLELYRAGAVRFEQEEVLGELRVSWTGEDAVAVTSGADEWSDP